jgi:hypothetical protein
MHEEYKSENHHTTDHIQWGNHERQKRLLALCEDDEGWGHEHDADFRADFESSLLNRQGHIFYTKKEIHIVVVDLITLDGCIGWRGIRVGNWVVHEGVAVRVDENGSDETISIKRILVAHDINLDWSTWDDDTIELLEAELPQ